MLSKCCASKCKFGGSAYGCLFASLQKAPLTETQVPGRKEKSIRRTGITVQSSKYRT